jgi:hypothetical protein
MASQILAPQQRVKAKAAGHDSLAPRSRRRRHRTESGVHDFFLGFAAHPPSVATAASAEFIDE